jgi:Protein of unknown function (DUF3071)
MQDLQLIGVHEDGEHLLLSGADDSRFLLPVDEALRAAIRRDRPHLGQQQIEADGGLRPRDVQALIRAGASSEEAASRAGWTVEKVHRYEGPILAEREHVAGLAQKARLRTRNGVSSGVAPTLAARVAERLKSRDVEVTETNWDSWRAEGGPWTVVLTFAAGGRQRQASWSFDLADRTVSAVDDEARWLSEEVQTAKGPIPAPPHRPSPGRDTTVYDVEAEGGLRPVSREDHQDDPLDLMSAMRKRSSARGRRRPGIHGSSPNTGSAKAAAPRTDSPRTDSPSTDSPSTDSPGTGSPQSDPGATDADQQPLDQTLPLQDLGYDAEMAPQAAEADTSRDPSRTAPDQGHDGQPGSGQATDVDADDGYPRVAREPDESSPDHVLPDEASADGSSPDEASPDETGQTEEVPQRPAQRSQTKARKRPREAARKTGRPSVPAWDEIMFGSRPGADRSSS